MSALCLLSCGKTLSFLVLSFTVFFFFCIFIVFESSIAISSHCASSQHSSPLHTNSSCVVFLCALQYEFSPFVSFCLCIDTLSLLPFCSDGANRTRMTWRMRRTITLLESRCSTACRSRSVAPQSCPKRLSAYFFSIFCRLSLSSLCFFYYSLALLHVLSVTHTHTRARTPTHTYEPTSVDAHAS